MEKIKQLEKEMMRLDLPHFIPGDTVKVHVKIKEGEKRKRNRSPSITPGDAGTPPLKIMAAVFPAV